MTRFVKCRISWKLDDSGTMRKELRESDLGLIGDIDSQSKAGDLANQAAYSKPQFFRLAKRQLGEPPMAVRRRLLLERAAYRLTRSKESVTGIAFDAGFESLEGFSRAFRTAFGISASHYRKLRADEYRIDLTERLHYAPTPSLRQGENNLNVPELMAKHHCWEMVRFIDACEKLPDARLDEPMPAYEPQPWCDPTVTLRQMLGRACAFAAPWMDSINGEKTDYEPATLAAMRDAVSINLEGFLKLLTAIDKEGSYDMTFVDSECDPPMVFSYVGVLTHALTNAAYRRMVISQELRLLGVGIEGVRDPIDYVDTIP